MNPKTPKITRLWLVVIILGGMVLAACGDTAAEVSPTPNPTNTPRPTFNLQTPTLTLPVTAEATPTLPPTRNPRTPIPAPTRTPTPNPRVTPSPSPDPSATPIALTPAVTPTSRASKVIGGDLISARDRDPSSLHTYGSPDPVGKEYRALLYNARLLKRNPQTLNWESNAAYAFKYDEASRSVAIVLRNDIRWSDGVPITTDDFIWTWQFASDNGRGWADLALYSGKIDSYSAPDKRTLLVKLHDNYSNPLEIANLIEPLPKHIWDGQSWSETDKNLNINQPTVVSGPWKLKEWKPDDRIVFVRNELSTVSPPSYLSSLTFIRADNKTALQMLRQGQLDFYSPPPSNFNDLRDMPKVVTYRWDSATPNWNFLGFNFRRPLWQAKGVRQALNTATNRADIIKQLAYGLGSPLYSDVPPGNPDYTEAVERPAYNLEQAQALLLGEGYRLNGPRLLGKDGKELPEISLIYNPDGEVRPKLADYYARQLGQLGFKVKLVPLEYQTFMARLQDPTPDFDLFLLGWKPYSVGIEQFGMVWKDNFGRYNNKTLTDLYNKASHEPNKALRQDIMVQIQQLEAQDLPYIYLYAEQQFMGVAAYVDGVEEGSLGVAANLYSDWFIRQ